MSNLHLPLPPPPPTASLWAGVYLEDAQPRGKRPRVALACQRCKSRKQKCDGCNPCSKCRSLDVECEYVVPQKPMPFGKNQYIKSLEHRVAELESLLAAQGMSELSNDHWKVLGTSPTTTASARVGSEGRTHVGSEPDDGDLDDVKTDAVLDWQDGVDSVVSVLRSLSLDVNGSGYIGASSHVGLGRLFSFLNKNGHRHNPHRQTSTVTAPGVTEDPIDFSDVPSAVADRLFAGYKKHISTRYPIVYSVWVKHLHDTRHTITDPYEVSILHMVYAASGRFLETTGEFGGFYPKRHYAAALRHLETILDFNDTRPVTVLMLMAIYCLRDPIGPGAWTYSRTAMLMAIDRGLHRQTTALKRSSLESELRKRLFWACYAFDRAISITMGRPFAISDRDIDVALPMDIDEAITREEVMQLTANITQLNAKPGTSTSLSSFIHIVRLRRIESDIQQTIYRVDQAVDCTIPDEVIDGFLKTLDDWKAMIPQDTHTKKDVGDNPFDGHDYYMVFYFKAQRLLLYPQLSKSSVAPRFLKECARACAGVCGAYKRLHQSLAVGYSIMSLQTVFMAGLTLVYCIWISPDSIFDLTTSNGIHDCSIVLFVVAERVAAAKKYRNAFEVIRQRVIDTISQTSVRKPREAVAGLTAELAPSAHSFQVNMPFEVDNDSYEQFSQIITAMTGEDFAAGLTRFGHRMHPQRQHHGLPDRGGSAGGNGFDFPHIGDSESLSAALYQLPPEPGLGEAGPCGIGFDLSWSPSR